MKCELWILKMGTGEVYRGLRGVNCEMRRVICERDSCEMRRVSCKNEEGLPGMIGLCRDSG